MKKIKDDYVKEFEDVEEKLWDIIRLVKCLIEGYDFVFKFDN